MRSKAPPRGAFTLAELLSALAVLAVLSGVLLPVLASAREKGRQASCLSNLRHLGLACLLYAEDFDQALPTHRAGGAGEPSPWMAAVRAYGAAADDTLRCPADASDWGMVDPYYKVRRQSSYLFNFYLYDPDAEPGAPPGSCGYNTLSRIGRPASTVLLAEQPTGTPHVAHYGDHFHAYAFRPNPWCRKESPEAQLATDRHQGGANYAFVDGHVRWHRFAETLNWRWDAGPRPPRLLDLYDPDPEDAQVPLTVSGADAPPSCSQYVP